MRSKNAYSIHFGFKMHHLLRIHPTVSSSRRLLDSDKIHSSRGFIRFLLTTPDDVPPRSDVCKPDLMEVAQITTAVLEEKSYLKPFGQRREKIEVNGVRLNWDAVGTGEHVILLLPGAVGKNNLVFFCKLEHLHLQIL